MTAPAGSASIFSSKRHARSSTSSKRCTIFPAVSKIAASSALREIVVRHASSSESPCFIACKNRRSRIHSALHKKMKEGIHPEYNETDMVCACGTVYHTRSTSRDIKIGICAACHPFFTGEQKFVDTAGRVEKFARRYGSTKAARFEKKA